MPIDASSDPSDGGLGPTPAVPKIDLDLGDAGTGAKSSKEFDLDLDDAGQGAKIDPSSRDDDPTSIDKDLDVGPTKDLDLGADPGPAKDLDIGASDHDDHLKGFHADDDGHDHDHHDHHDHGHHDDHGHDDLHDHH